MFVSADGFDWDMRYLLRLVAEVYSLRLGRIRIGFARLQIGVQEKNVWKQLDSPFRAVFSSIFIYILTSDSTAHAQMLSQWKIELNRIIPEISVARSVGQR